MAGTQRPNRFRWLWIVLMAIPPVIIISGLIVVFWWQGSKGGVTPKWKKPEAARTNSPATNR